MGLVVKQTTTSTPDGNYFSVLVGVYDIGTQPSDKFEPSHQVILQWELHNKKGVILTKEGNRLLHSQYFSLAFGVNRQTKEKSKLRQAVEGMSGRAFTESEAKQGFDLFELVGIGSRLRITDGRLASISPLDEDDKPPLTESDEVAYELDPAKQIPASVPPWIVKLIKKSQEWTKVHGSGEDDDAGNGKPARKPVAQKAAKAQQVPVGANADDDDDDPAF